MSKSYLVTAYRCSYLTPERTYAPSNCVMTMYSSGELDVMIDEVAKLLAIEPSDDLYDAGYQVVIYRLDEEYAPIIMSTKTTRSIPLKLNIVYDYNHPLTSKKWREKAKKIRQKIHARKRRYKEKCKSSSTKLRS